MELNLESTATEDRQQEFYKAIVDLVVDTSVPFNIFGMDYFKKLVGVSNRELTPKHPTTIARKFSFISTLAF